MWRLIAVPAVRLAGGAGCRHPVERVCVDHFRRRRMSSGVWSPSSAVSMFDAWSLRPSLRANDHRAASSRARARSGRWPECCRHRRTDDDCLRTWPPAPARSGKELRRRPALLRFAGSPPTAAVCRNSGPHRRSDSTDVALCALARRSGRSSAIDARSISRSRPGCPAAGCRCQSARSPTKFAAGSRVRPTWVT